MRNFCLSAALNVYVYTSNRYNPRKELFHCKLESYVRVRLNHGSSNKIGNVQEFMMGKSQLA